MRHHCEKLRIFRKRTSDRSGEVKDNEKEAIGEEDSYRCMGLRITSKKKKKKEKEG